MITLLAYIQDQREASSVTISPDDAIHDLKDRIKDKWSNLLLGFDATALTLTKVDEDLKEVANKINNIGHYWPDSEDRRVLQFTEKICEVWPSPPSRDRLHVFVGLPAAVDQPSLKRRRLSDAGDLEAPSWLKEFHSKIWNKKDLKEELFRTVKITRAHYDKLQSCLNSRNPVRNSPEYNASNHNVLSVKLDCLQPIAEGGALPPGASVEDDHDEISSLFPFTLTYVDFSTLGLEAKHQRFPPVLLHRQEYNHISELINKRPKTSAGSVIFSGQPGTGKTVYLYVRMIECLIEGCPFLYQTKEGDVYHVAQNGVEAVRHLPLENPKTHIMAFVDDDKGDCEPKDFLFDTSVQIIVATSPRGVNRKWVWQAESYYETIFAKLATDLWSPQELFLTGIFLHPYDISLELLREATSYFGYNPRQCFNASQSVATLESEKDMLKGRIRGAAKDTVDFMWLLESSRIGNSEVSHTIFQLSPVDESRDLSKCHFDAVSPWALDVLVQRYQIHEADAVASLCRSISGVPDAATLRGHLFERQVLTYLDDIETYQVFNIRQLADTGLISWPHRGRIPRFTFQGSEVIAKIRTVVEDEKPLHLVPSAPNFPAVDSIIYQPNDVLTCIQITMDSDHPIVVSGLKRIQYWLKRDTPPAGLLPDEKRKWRFIFIVPLDMASTFRLQKFEGDTAHSEWAGKVDQYVLGWEVGSLNK